MTEAMKRVLDPCCGSRMFWFDRQHPDVVYGDRRHETLTVTDRSHGRADGQRTLHIEPDVLLDFRDLPYPDGSFSLVVFDPPHLVRAGPKSWLAAKYGKLGPKRDGRGNIIMRKVRRNGQEVIEPVQKTRKVGGGRRVRWTNKAKRRAMAAMRPTGNPFLDLCIWKGRFPSRMAQFCTEELKRNMAVAFQLDLADSGKTVVSWQGVRRDESLNRRNAKMFERIGPGMYAYRPIVEWTAAQVFEFCGSRNLHPNPLYLQGMGRVGCMPCINANKEELRQISVRFPEHIERIAEWERIVGDCSKRGFSTLMADAHEAKDRRQIFADLNIWARVEWSRTSRGGRQLDMLADLIEPTACASAYGLCEQWQAPQQQEEARAA